MSEGPHWMACPNHAEVKLRDVDPTWGEGDEPSSRCAGCGSPNGPFRCRDCGALIEEREDERGHTIIVLLGEEERRGTR